jgi:ribosomal 30S subunit maturation factor RimM
MTNDTRLLVDAFGVAVGGGGTPPAVDPYVEVLNFAALPGSPAEGDTYIALESQGIRFINYKAAGLYRYTSGVWAYLGAVPEGYFTDNVLTFYDNVDPTKQAMLELSGITTGTSRVLTVPDKNGIIATLDDIVAGSSDHGALTGLGDDDHTQYHNDARGDLRYQPLSTVLTNTTASFTTADETKLDALAVMVGATAVANGVTGTVPVALAGDEAKVLLGNGTWAVPASGVTDHGALTGLSDDDHPQYHNDARGDLRYQPLSAVLTNTTASFTTADETKLDALAVMVGATALTNGVTGTVPAALAGDEAKVLRGDGTWVVSTSGVTDHGALTGLSESRLTLSTPFNGTHQHYGLIHYCGRNQVRRTCRYGWSNIGC